MRYQCTKANKTLTQCDASTIFNVGERQLHIEIFDVDVEKINE